MPSKQRGTYTALNWAMRSMVLKSFGPIFHFPFGLALFYCLALVVGFAAAAESQFHLDDAVLGVRSKRQKGETFLVQFPAQGPYLAGVQEEAPGAAGVVILAHVLRLVCGYLGIQEPGLAAADDGVAASKLQPAALRAFHLLPQEFQASLVGLEDIVIEPGPAVLRQV